MKKKRESKLGAVFCTPQIVSAVKRAEFLGDRMSYIVLRGRRCNIIVLNMNAPIEERRDDTKDMRNCSRFSIISLYHTKFCLDILM
jgi:hypothetical protein